MSIKLKNWPEPTGPHTITGPLLIWGIGSHRLAPHLHGRECFATAKHFTDIREPEWLATFMVRSMQ